MNHKFRILITISPVAVFSFPSLAKDVHGARLVTVTQNAGVSGSLTGFELDSRNNDLAITAKILERITVSKNLSLNAGNVKIITTDGRVVLKGAVNSTEEKRLIGDIAIGVQRRENVNNQLTVRLSPSAPTALRVVQ